MAKSPPSARGLLVAAPAAAVQGLAAVAYAIFLIEEVIRVGATGPVEVSNGAADTVLIAIVGLIGAALMWCSVGLWRERRWARAPIILFEIIIGIVSFNAMTNPGYPSWIRIAFGALCVMAAGTLVSLFLPSTTAALNHEQS
jgi:hypothetical protein